jgi:hypothetical protein
MLVWLLAQRSNSTTKALSRLQFGEGIDEKSDFLREVEIANHPV